MDNQQAVLFDVLPGTSGNIGLITLNRPSALNSLNKIMVDAIYEALQQWSPDPSIKAVIIQAAPGRAFCAGGDLRQTYDNMQADRQSPVHFFRDEYQLNSLIFHFPKPYIALLDGITMGGGVGISIHGSHRIGTEKLIFAMPETGIGFFPDIGGTYFLPRISGKVGYYLGLTGARLGVDDALTMGLVTHKVSSSELKNIIDRIATTEFSNDAFASVTKLMSEFHQPSAQAKLLDHQPEIDRCFKEDNMEAILVALQSTRSEFSLETLKILTTKSPTSLKVTLQALRQGAMIDFDDCMKQELILAHHFAVDHDFKEGIRAVIIDKDQTPHWQPATLEAVTKERVDSYFMSLAESVRS